MGTNVDTGDILLANGGVCCIDDLEKSYRDYDFLASIIDQQYLQVIKDGIVCKLTCNSSIIAAASPIGGHFEYLKFNDQYQKKFITKFKYAKLVDFTI